MIFLWESVLKLFLSWSGLGFRVAVIPIWCRLGQSGGICDGHHRCDDLCFFFAQGYAGCKSNSGGRCRTVCPHYPERSAALIYRWRWFPLPIPNLRVDWKGDPEVAFYNHTKTDKLCSFHAIVDVPFGRLNQSSDFIIFNSNFRIIDTIRVRLTILGSVFQQAVKMTKLCNIWNKLHIIGKIFSFFTR